MSSSSEDLKEKIEAARLAFEAYAAQQKGFEPPKAHITLDENSDFVDVHIDVESNGTKYHFEAMKLKHLELVYTGLFSQAKVRERYTTGKVQTLEQTTARVTDLSNRFRLKDEAGNPKQTNLYSGFAVTDAETDLFLGMANLGSSGKPGIAEMAFLNTTDSWSHIPEEIVKEYESGSKQRGKAYKGLGTTETCTMVQYTKFLKDKGINLCGYPLQELTATARIDNPGSWKASAKAGLEVYDIDVNPNYGPELRYQMRKKI